MKHLYGKKVRIKGIAHASDRELNGLTGTLMPKFFTDRGFLVFGDIGVFLDGPVDGAYVANILEDEFELEESCQLSLPAQPSIASSI